MDRDRFFSERELSLSVMLSLLDNIQKAHLNWVGINGNLGCTYHRNINAIKVGLTQFQ